MMDDLEVDDLMVMDAPAIHRVQLALEQRLCVAVNATVTDFPALAFPSFLLMLHTCQRDVRMANARQIPYVQYIQHIIQTEKNRRGRGRSITYPLTKLSAEN